MTSKKLIYTLLILTLITQGAHTLAMFRKIATNHQRLGRIFCTNTKTYSVKNNYSQQRSAADIFDIGTLFNVIGSVGYIAYCLNKVIISNKQKAISHKKLAEDRHEEITTKLNELLNNEK